MSERFRTRITETSLIKRCSNLESSGGRYLRFNAAPRVLPFHPYQHRRLHCIQLIYSQGVHKSNVSIFVDKTPLSLSRSTPSEHLEQIVVARNTSIYGVRNETEDTVWFLALLKTLFWLVPLLNYESCAIRTSHTSNTGPSFKSYHNVRGVFSMLHCCRATRLLMFVVLERISEHSYSNTFPNALALL